VPGPEDDRNFFGGSAPSNWDLYLLLQKVKQTQDEVLLPKVRENTQAIQRLNFKFYGVVSGVVAGLLLFAKIGGVV
jgi:hypothetical protein